MPYNESLFHSERLLAVFATASYGHHSARVDVCLDYLLFDFPHSVEEIAQDLLILYFLEVDCGLVDTGNHVLIVFGMQKVNEIVVAYQILGFVQRKALVLFEPPSSFGDVFVYQFIPLAGERAFPSSWVRSLHYRSYRQHPVMFISLPSEVFLLWIQIREISIQEDIFRFERQVAVSELMVYLDWGFEGYLVSVLFVRPERLQLEHDFGTESRGQVYLECSDARSGTLQASSNVVAGVVVLEYHLRPEVYLLTFLLLD